MRVAIMQPTYLPWCGYFDLMDQVDLFVFLDDVAFQKRSWQQRNRVVGPAGLSWLTVPVKAKGKRGQLVGEVEIADTTVLAKHARTLESFYASAPCVDAMLGEYELAANAVGTSLCMLNLGLIEAMCRALQVSTPWVLASEVTAGGRRGEHLARLCSAVGATEYLSPPGSIDYLLEDRASFEERGIAVHVHTYEHPQYAQGREEFLSHASAFDLLARVGGHAGEILRSGRRRSTRLISEPQYAAPMEAIA